MTEGKYTISEIDEMRRCVNRLWLGPTLYWVVSADGNAYSNGGRSYSAAERTVEVEARLRTYMMNGTTLEELRAAEAEMDAQTRAALDKARRAAGLDAISGKGG